MRSSSSHPADVDKYFTACGRHPRRRHHHRRHPRRCRFCHRYRRCRGGRRCRPRHRRPRRCPCQRRATAASGVRCLSGAASCGSPCRRWPLARLQRAGAPRAPPMRRGPPRLGRAGARAGGAQGTAGAHAEPAATRGHAAVQHAAASAAGALRRCCSQRTAGAQRAVSRRCALAPLGARGGARTAAVHGGRRTLAEPQPPLARLPLAAWCGGRRCAQRSEGCARHAREAAQDRRKRAPHSGV